MSQKTPMGGRKWMWIAVLSLAGSGAALAQTTRPTGVRIIPGTIIGPDAADAVRLLEITAEQPAPVPTTSPTTAPTTQTAVARLQKFRVRFNRTPVSSLKALSTPTPPDMDEGARFVADVQAGRWTDVGKAIASFPPADAKTLYRHLITELSNPPLPQQPQAGPAGGIVEAPTRAPGVAPQIFVSPEDVLAIMSVAPGELDADLIDPLGLLLVRAMGPSGVIEPVLARLEQGVAGIGGPTSAGRQKAAILLIGAGRAVEAVPFLPALNADLGSNDIKLLDLHSRCLTALSARDESRASQAWDVTRAYLVHSKATPKDRETAMGRAMELLPRLPKSAVSEWLDLTFRQNSDQGMALLAGTGAAVSQNFLSRDITRRERDLMQQKAVVEQLLSQAQESARWVPLLDALAALWMQEADYTRVRPSVRQLQQQQRVVIDDLGNRTVQTVSSGEPPPLDATQILSSAPTDAWMKVLEPARQAAIRANLAQMYFKNDTPQDALPILELLATSYPKLARDLAADLLRNLSRVWSSTQGSNRASSYYINSSGSYVSVMQNVVLTRLAQARNLAELSLILHRIEKLGGEPPDQGVVVSVFVSAHSPAEVFEMAEIQKVFGPPEKMDREALFSLTQSMRQRLASGWRSAAVQQQQQTKRTDKETDAEVTRGYQLVTDLLKARLATGPDWKLQLVQASALFDWAEFDYGKQVELAVYTARRDQAFDLYAKAAAGYSDDLATIKVVDQSPLVFTQWFSAALGASDMGALTRQSAPSPTQIQQIRTALFGLPEEARERHLASFGRMLGESANSLRPEIKHRFLTAGIDVLGSHESVREAELLVQYYKELLAEVELHAEVDGDPVIGHSRPFGLHLMLRHTQTLGRESGGFAKYLSSGTGSGAILNTNGQPVSFRDEFEKKIRESLVERFEIVSIAWHDAKVEAMSYGKPGWRQTPLAYVLLKPKDAAVDKIPAVQLDLELTDRQGPVILPVSSQIVLVDARPESAPARPVSKLEITQLLDQRDTAAGKVSLDIKATGRGLLPDLAELLEVKVPGFKVDKTSDLAMVINRMDTDGERPTPISEHSWLINLSAENNDQASLAFRFPQPRAKDAKMAYRQYSDADVVDVDPELAVAGLPIRTSRWWTYALVIGGILMATVVAIVMILRRRANMVEEVAPVYGMPSSLTPFNVLSLLQRIQGDTSVSLQPDHQQRLAGDIQSLQQSYFSPSGTNGNGNGHADLKAIAARWVQQVGG